MGTTAGNRTIETPSNPTDGEGITFRIQQNTNNTGTIVFESAYVMNEGGTPVAGTEATWNYVSFRYNAAGTQWDHLGNSLGII